jgi:hypothetical protein
VIAAGLPHDQRQEDRHPELRGGGEAATIERGAAASSKSSRVKPINLELLLATMILLASSAKSTIYDSRRFQPIHRTSSRPPLPICGLQQTPAPWAARRRCRTRAPRSRRADVQQVHEAGTSNQPNSTTHRETVLCVSVAKIRRGPFQAGPVSRCRPTHDQRPYEAPRTLRTAQKPPPLGIP